MSDALVTANYDRGELIPRIAEGFAAAGIDVDGISIDDLAVVDEFHTGSRAATEHVMATLGVSEGMRVLDVGCGIGGPARYCAAHLGATVDGVDLTPSYVDAARALTEWVGLGDRARFHTGDGGSLAFDDATFDRAYLLHVGMNVEDKVALFAELARLVRPEGRVAVYDLMATGEPGPTFPVPWARDPGASFLADPAHYTEALGEAGFTGVAVEDRREHVLAFMTAAAEQAAEADGPPPIGLHLLMGDDAGQRLQNMVASLRAGAISPVLLVADRP